MLVVLIEGFDQHMLQGTKWPEFLTRGDNKEELINLILRNVQKQFYVTHNGKVKGSFFCKMCTSYL